MEKIKLALVGCGGMGTRHLYGLGQLARTPFNNIELVALCDINLDNARLAAGEAEKLLGAKPQVFDDLGQMTEKIPDLDAVDVVTDPSVHHTVVCQALDLGLHVLVEKPLAITVGTCRMMVEAAQRNRRFLSVAENYRRDPSARLVRHLLQAGAIGRPYMAQFQSVRGGRAIFITPWRHLKDKGGPLLDMGVHFADLIRYQLGDIAEVYADVRLIEKTRLKPEAIGDPYDFYQKRFKAMDREVPATAEDSAMAMLRMESGLTLSWAMCFGGHGSNGVQQILGDKGCIDGFGSRGSGTRLLRDGQGATEFAELLQQTPDFRLDGLAEHFFPQRSSVGDKEVDWKLIAMEQYELAAAIIDGTPVEIDGVEGLKDVAAVYALCESARAGRAVRMDEVENCQVYAYQAEIDAALGVG